MIKCFYCENPSAVYRKISGEYLCKKHFIESVEKKVKKTINKYELLSETDIIAVGVSGGKDSLTMLNILDKLEKKFKETKLIAITIDEGIKNYREEALDFAKKITQKLGIIHYVYSFKDIFGYNLDEIVVKLNNYGADYASPCSFCGVLRRTALNYAARDVGATKLATAHNLDDESQTSLMNFLRADITRIFRTGPKLDLVNKKFVVRIKPLTEIPEREILLYAYFKNLPLHSQSCPYAPTAMRNDMRDFLNEMEKERPEIKYNIQKISDKIRMLFKPTENELKINICSECGEPTTQEICKTCQFIKIIRNSNI